MFFDDMDRRTFMKGTAASALALGLPTYAFADGHSAKRGGTLRAGLSGGSTSDSLDPATWAAGPIVYSMLGGCCNNLVEINEKGEAVPELAETIEPSADAKTWTFKLRKNVTFSNGKKLTAKDVIASFNHHRAEGSKSAAKGLLEQITDIRADGDHTVIFELVGGNADFPFVAADYHLVIMQDDGTGKMDWKSAVGTGGYTLVKNEPGVKITLKRRDDYWKEGRAWFDNVELLIINDSTARQNALATGQVDLIDRVDTKTVHLLKRRPGIELLEVTGSAHYTMPMFTDHKPFNDVNVRLALKYGVDREEMVRKVLRGHGSVGNDHPIAPANRFYAKNLEQRVFDPDKAKFHLKKAGMDSLSVDISTSNAAFTGAVDAAVLFKETAAKSGITLNIKREPDDGYWSNVWLKKPFCFCYWNGRPTEDWMFSLVYAKGGKWNDTHWDNKRFNELLVAARAELDEGKRRTMYEEMQAITRDDAGTIIPMFANYLDARTQKVTHGKLAANRFLDGWKFIERWWAA